MKEKVSKAYLYTPDIFVKIEIHQMIKELVIKWNEEIKILNN